MSITSNPISYTNKDFRSIYEEILTLAKQLSYKWDPTISNESDPGVVLLKLNAIIGDKNNYNIDKNILEAFPETVTQQTSARQLFSQLGYKMPWYRAASTNITLKWIGRELVLGEIINIPKFTMVTNDESDVVYTLIEDLQITRTTINGIATVKALQGNIVHYDIAGNRTIKSSNFDKLNRLYLNDYNVAENGIFIHNVTDKSIEWTLVDNIQLYPTGSYVYEFNVDPRTNYCYLEFPEDFDVLIGSGINISYITTKGSQGNVKSKNLTNFFNDISIKLSGEDIALNSSVMEVYNNSSATDGSDPQDIEGAYRSYKKVAGTFDTLVTLRDYLNAAFNSGLISNGVVSDRMNDIQTTYSIITTNTESLNSELIQEKLDDDGNYQFVKVWPADKRPVYKNNHYYKFNNNQMELISADWGELSEDSPNIYVLKSTDTTDLTAYDLRMYLLRNVGQVNNLTDYNNSFQLVDSQNSIMSELYGYLENLQCVQHNFKDILKDRYCMFKVVYPLRIKVVPQYKLTDTQINTLKNNIFEALRKTLNSRNVDFGVEPDYDVIYNTIQTADNRIKFIMMDDFQYMTYAVYWDEVTKSFKEIPISEFRAENTIFGTWSELQDEKSKSENADCYFIDNSDYKCYVVKNNRLEEYSDKIQEFRKEILAKSVLAGVTSLFNVDNRFQYTVNRVEEKVIENVNEVTTKLTIVPFGGTPILKNTSTGEDLPPEDITIKPYEGVETKSTTYVLKENESLRFYGPSFKNSVSYSNYVKFMVILKEATGFEYHIVDLKTDLPISTHNPVYLYEYVDNEYIYKEYNSNATVQGNDGTRGTITDLSNNGNLQVFRKVPSYNIPSNVNYKLREGDSITFFWREEQDDNAPYVYKRYFGINEDTVNPNNSGDRQKSPVICASFTIVASDTFNPPVPVQQLRGDSGKIEKSDAVNSAYYKISKLYGDNDLSGSKTIDIKEINEISLKVKDTKDNPYYYFITNNVIEESGIQKYKMTFSDKRYKKYVRVWPSKTEPQYKKDTYYRVHEGRQELIDDETKFNEYKDNNTNIYIEQNDPNWTYILEDDEFYIQMNNGKSAYEIYGPGTMLRVPKEYTSGDSYELTVDAIDYTDIVNEGVKALQKVVVSLQTSIDIREQQMYTLTGGDKVYFTLNDTYFNTNDISVSEVSNKDSGLPYFKLEKNSMSTSVLLQRCYESNGEPKQEPVNYITRDVNDDCYLLPNCVVTNFTPITQKSKIDTNMFKCCQIKLQTDVTRYNIFNPDKLTTIGGTLCMVRRDDPSSIVPKFHVVDTEEAINNDVDYFLCEVYTRPDDIPTSTKNYLYVCNELGQLTRATDTQIENTETTLYLINYNNISTYLYKAFKEYTYYKVDNGSYTLVTTRNIQDRMEGVVILRYTEVPKLTVDDKYVNNNYYLIGKCTDIYDGPLTYLLDYRVRTVTEDPVFTSDDYTAVSDITITFSTNGSTIQSLPTTNVGDSDGGWYATARLNVQSSNSTPQPLHEMTNTSLQMYKIIREDGTEEIIYQLPEGIEPGDFRDGREDIAIKYILTNVEVSKVGGKNVDVSYVDLLGNRHGIDIQVYTNNKINTQNSNSFWSDGYGNLYLKADTLQEYSINGIKCEENYFYILPIQNNSLSAKFKVKTNSLKESVYTIHQFDTEYQNGVYYFVLPTEEDINITITITNTDKNAVVSLLPFVKYRDEKLFEQKYGITVPQIINKMKHFDKENKFRYNYIVPDGKLIIDPLTGKEFFNSNHICNQFTIAQANLNSSRTNDGVKALPNNSEVVIVSNR